MTSKYRGSQVLIGFVCAALAACATPPHTPTSTPSPTPTLTDTPTAAPSPTNTQPAPTKPALKPLAVADGIEVVGWSPDGRWIAYRARGDLTVTPSHGDALFLVSADGSQRCTIQPAPISGDPEHEQYVAWQSDSRLLVLAQGGIAQNDPCQPGDRQDRTGLFPARLAYIAGISPDGSIFLFTSDQGYFAYFVDTHVVRQLARNIGGFRTGVAWSPDLKHVALAGFVHANNTNPSRVWLVNLVTGALDAAVDFATASGDGTLSAQTWLNNRLVLIQTSGDKGPLRVSVDGTVTPVAQLFGQSMTMTCGGWTCVGRSWAIGAQETTTGHYHIIYWGLEDPDARMMLYHCEDGRTEALPGGNSWMSPDGHWAVFDDFNAGTSGYARPIDDASAPKGTGTPVSMPFSWSPDSRHVALFSQSLVAVYRLADGVRVGYWPARRPPAYWSPDGKMMAFIGSPPGAYGEALYVVEVP